MRSDPYEARRTGARRLRAVTASVGAAAVVGTGVLAWSMSAEAAPAGDDGSGELSGGGLTTVTTDDDNPFVQVQPPQIARPGNSHASSGGS